MAIDLNKDPKNLTHYEYLEQAMGKDKYQNISDQQATLLTARVADEMKMLEARKKAEPDQSGVIDLHLKKLKEIQAFLATEESRKAYDGQLAKAAVEVGSLTDDKKQYFSLKEGFSLKDLTTAFDSFAEKQIKESGGKYTKDNFTCETRGNVTILTFPDEASMNAFLSQHTHMLQRAPSPQQKQFQEAKEGFSQLRDQGKKGKPAQGEGIEMSEIKTPKQSG